MFPNSKFIHVIRDGRDVALSTAKAPWRNLNYFERVVYEISDGIPVQSNKRMLHKSELRYRKISRILPDKMIQLLLTILPKNNYFTPKSIEKIDYDESIFHKFYPIKNNYENALWRWKIWNSNFNEEIKLSNNECYSVKYEDIIRDPESNFKNIFNFIGIEWDKNCLNYGEHKHDTLNIDYGVSTTENKKSIDSSNINKWKDNLTYSQKIITRKYFDSYLKELGYNETS
jgi:hypothetical protein